MQAEVEKTPTVERWRLSHNGVPYWYVTKTAKGWTFRGSYRHYETRREATEAMLNSRMRKIRKELKELRDGNSN